MAIVTLGSSDFVAGQQREQGVILKWMRDIDADDVDYDIKWECLYQCILEASRKLENQKNGVEED